MAHPASPGARFAIWLGSTLLVLPAQLVFAGGAIFSVGGIFLQKSFEPGTLALLPVGLAVAAMLIAFLLELSIVSRLNWWRFRLRLSEVARAQHGEDPVRLRSADVRFLISRYGIELDDTRAGGELSSVRARQFAPIAERWAHPLSSVAPRRPRMINWLWIVGLAILGLWLLGALAVWAVRSLLGS
jgi:hypothetical protein